MSTGVKPLPLELQTMFSALKSAVGVSLSGEVKHAFPSFHAISAVDIDGANVRVSPALLRHCFSSRLRYAC